MDLTNILQAATIVLIVLGGFFLRSYLPNYFSEKGKNLATKEDIKEITEKVEEVRSQYARELHIHQIAFDKEFEILDELWKALLEFNDATNQLHLSKQEKMEVAVGNDPLDSINGILKLENSSAVLEKRIPLFENFKNAFVALLSLRNKDFPFYPLEIHNSLGDLIALCLRDFMNVLNYEHLSDDVKEQDWDTIEKNRLLIRKQIDRIAEQIRARINPS